MADFKLTISNPKTGKSTKKDVSGKEAEALLGKVCPLTLWEDALRGAHSDTSFIARWIHHVMFYSFPEWVFTTAYVLFAFAVAVTFWIVPPRRRGNR
jgi:hypothetical protein